MALGGKREAGGVDAKRGRGELGRGGRGVKGATLVVVAGKAACGAPGGLAHGRDVAEAMGRGGGGRRQVGASSLAWPGRQASPATCAGGLCRSTEQGRVRERREEREGGGEG